MSTKTKMYSNKLLYFYYNVILKIFLFKINKQSMKSVALCYAYEYFKLQEKKAKVDIVFECIPGNTYLYVTSKDFHGCSQIFVPIFFITQCFGGRTSLTYFITWKFHDFAVLFKKLNRTIKIQEKFFFFSISKLEYVKTT